MSNVFEPVQLDFWRDPGFARGKGVLEVRRSAYRESAFMPHTHDTVSMSLVESGRVHYMHMGVYRHAGPGDIAIIGPDEVHACNKLPGEDMVYVMFSIEPWWWAQLAQALPTDFRPSPDFGSAPTFSDPLLKGSPHFAKLQALFQALLEGPSQLERESLMHEAFSAFLLDHAVHGELREPDAPSAVQEAVAKARELLGANLAESLSLEELSRACAMSPYHLLRVFKQETGLPPHAFRNQARIQTARRLLAQSMPIAQVAQETGFTDQSHLNRNFKQAVGATPKQYQQAHTFPEDVLA